MATTIPTAAGRCGRSCDGSCRHYCRCSRVGVSGPVIDVLVTVQNVGNQDVTGDVNVTLADGDLNIGIQTISGGLDAGQSTSLTFTWNTAGATIGDHTLTAAQDLLDDTLANDSGSTIVSVQEVGATMHVADLDGWATILSRNWWYANVEISVLNAVGAPVVGATVTGTWSDGTTSASTLTDSNGQTTVSSASLHRQ